MPPPLTRRFDLVIVRFDLTMVKPGILTDLSEWQRLYHVSEQTIMWQFDDSNVSRKKSIFGTRLPRLRWHMLSLFVSHKSAEFNTTLVELKELFDGTALSVLLRDILKQHVSPQANSIQHTPRTGNGRKDIQFQAYTQPRRVSRTAPHPYCNAYTKRQKDI